MNRQIKSLLTFVFAGPAVLAACAAHASAAPDAKPGSKASYGTPAPAASADYHLTVTPNTKWLNVDNGDTVQFDAAGKSFTWHFSTLWDSTALNLSAIAPADVKVGTTRVFVGADPKYLN